MIKVYHGTSLKNANNILNNGIKLDAGRPEADFGLGFYTTKNFEQANVWAKKKTKRSSSEAAVVAFYCNEELLNGFSFNGKTKEWSECIIDNRANGIDRYTTYDYIEGDMADGNIYIDAREYRAGRITKRQFIKRFSKDIGNQIVFKTKNGIDSLKYGHIVESEDD